MIRKRTNKKESTKKNPRERVEMDREEVSGRRSCHVISLRSRINKISNKRTSNKKKKLKKKLHGRGVVDKVGVSS